jgi:hypothetical protein
LDICPGPLAVSGQAKQAANWIALAHPAFHAFRKQLPTIRTLNEALHPKPPQIMRESYRANHIKRIVFIKPGSKADIGGYQSHVCSTPECGRSITAHYANAAVDLII